MLRWSHRHGIAVKKFATYTSIFLNGKVIPSRHFRNVAWAARPWSCRQWKIRQHKHGGNMSVRLTRKNGGFRLACRTNGVSTSERPCRWHRREVGRSCEWRRSASHWPDWRCSGASRTPMLMGVAPTTTRPRAPVRRAAVWGTWSSSAPGRCYRSRWRDVDSWIAQVEDKRIGPKQCTAPSPNWSERQSRGACDEWLLWDLSKDKDTIRGVNSR